MEEADHAAAARSLAQEAALRARDEAEQSRLGIALTSDVKRALRLVLLKTGGKVMTAFAQKTFQALPIAYAAIACKQAEQMSKDEVFAATTKTLVEFSIPEFIVLVKAAAKELKLPLPLDFDEKMYLTSLGTGKKAALSFDDKPKACWTKWETIKRDYTKEIQIIYDEGPQTASEFESGQSSEDYAAKVLETAWQRSDECKKALTVDLTETAPVLLAEAGSLSAAAAKFQEVDKASAGAGAGREKSFPKPECDCEPPQECIIRVEADTGDKYWGCAAEALDPITGCSCYILHGDDDDGGEGLGDAEEGGLPSSGGAGAAGEGGGFGGPEAAGEQEAAGAEKSPPVPDGWFHPYVIIAAAWSPWSGNCPTQFQNLVASEGKAPTNKKGDQIASGTLSSPGALAESTASARKMENNEGVPVSRRAHQVAVKAEADRVRREKKDKENMAQQEQTLTLRREALQAMRAGNENSGKLVVTLDEMVTLKRKAEDREHAAAEAATRKRKIGAIEKLLCMQDTMEDEKRIELRKQLAALLLEEVYG